MKRPRKLAFVSSKGRRHEEVLSESHYIHDLETIIERDYFPDLHNGRKIMRRQEMSLHEYQEKFTSEDNDSFEVMQQLEIREHKRAHGESALVLARSIPRKFYTTNIRKGNTRVKNYERIEGRHKYVPPDQTARERLLRA